MESSADMQSKFDGSMAINKSNQSNGSIITMTLKNNHLIVETEERNVSEMLQCENALLCGVTACKGVWPTFDNNKLIV